MKALACGGGFGFFDDMARDNCFLQFSRLNRQRNPLAISGKRGRFPFRFLLGAAAAESLRTVAMEKDDKGLRPLFARAQDFHQVRHLALRVHSVLPGSPPVLHRVEFDKAVAVAEDTMASGGKGP